MKEITKVLKEKINLIDSIEERLEYLKDKYVGETAYIVTCGPSLASHDANKLREVLKDKLVFSIKQAYNVVANETDFHLLNTYNLSDYKWNSDSIVYWTLSKSFAGEQLDRISKMGVPIDLFIPVINPPFLDGAQTTQATCNFDDFYMMETHTEVKWGRGMMYEMAIPLALLLGCTNLVIVAWDNETNGQSKSGWNHFYNHDVVKTTKPANGEIEELLYSTDKLYDWLQSKGIGASIVSDISLVSNKFPRIEL